MLPTKLLAPTLALAAALGLAATAGAQDDQQAKTLATVDGDPVTKAELNQLIQQQSRGQASLAQLGPAQRQQLLEQVIQLQLLAEHARGEGLGNQPEVAAELTNNRRTVLARAFITQMREDGSISEDTLRQRYEQQYGGDNNADQEKTEYKAQHILVDEEETAKEVIGKLDEGGDFAELAKEYSTGPSSSKGGDLGWFAPDEMVPPFSQAVAEMDKGSYTEEPVKTQFGWHVIKLEDTRKAQPPKFAEVRGQLEQQVVRERVESQIAELRDAADVEVTADWASQNSAAEDTENGGATQEGGTQGENAQD